jgi:hypothetical protein
MKTLATTCSLAAALAIAACGSSQKPTTGNQSGPSFKTVVSDAYRYSNCMRQHGVPNFPDPKVNDQNGDQSIAIRSIGPGPNSAGGPQYTTALNACKGVMPPPGNSGNADQSPAHKQGLLAFAQCMRTHGVSSFPDPSSQGQLTLPMLKAANVDLGSPKIQQDAYSCAPASDGQITRADVHQALAKAGA